MTFFSHEMRGYRDHPAYKAFEKFFNSYLLERDYDKTLALLDDDFYSLGMGKEEIALNKIEFSKLLRAELEIMKEPIGYKVDSICGKEIAENIWNILATMEVFLPRGGEEKVGYLTRFTGCLRLQQGEISILSTHMSEASSITGSKEFLPLKYVESKTFIDKGQAGQIVVDIMSKVMPGGIVSGYVEEGFPLYFVNEQYLKLLGYSSYEEYYKDAEGLGISHIHPDDRERVNQLVLHSYSMDTQYGIEYRIRHRDGHYIYVYDIGKKMLTPDDKEAVVCVLYDMTENAKQKEILLHESSYDALTGVYNRGSGVHAIERALKDVGGYSFAFFDVDNLKLLNDVYSHAVGDFVLKHFAELLKKHFGERTILVRLGGDEFVAFFREQEEKLTLNQKFSELEKEYCGFIEENYSQSHSSVSIGCVSGTRRYTFDELYQMADKLMYDIKKNGKCGYKIKEFG